MGVQGQRLADRRQTVKRGHRHLQLVAEAIHIKDEVRRLFFSQGAAQTSNHVSDPYFWPDRWLTTRNDSALPYPAWRYRQAKLFEAMMLSETQATATATCSAQAMGQQAGTGVRMAQGNRQGIRGVDLRLGGELEQVHDHHHHLFLVGAPGTGHGLLDLGRGVFGDLEGYLGAGDHGRAP